MIKINERFWQLEHAGLKIYITINYWCFSFHISQIIRQEVREMSEDSYWRKKMLKLGKHTNT